MAATTITIDGGNRIQTYEDFVKVHAVLLAASGIPQSLYPTLFDKLTNETFDGGNYFQIEPVEEVEGRQRRLVFTSEFLGKESNLFVVDHAWTFRLSDAYKQVWSSNPRLDFDRIIFNYLVILN